MVTTIFKKPRTFNVFLVEQALGINGRTVQWAGFETDQLGRIKPFAEATRVIGRDGVREVDDTAARGEIRIGSVGPLTTAERTNINQILDDHDDTIDDTRQAEERAAAADLVTLKTQHDAGITDPVDALLARILLAESGVSV